MTIKSRVWIAMVVLALAGGALMAQEDGRVEGRITRADGGGIGGVTVVIDELGLVEITDSGGNFAFGGVPAGDYTVRFTLNENTASESVAVAGGEVGRVDVSVDWDVSFVETITVTSASRRAERITEAPSAVTVVTEEQIAREAATGQVPKLLEFTPGAEVTQSGIYDYNLNTRGFNSSLNRRVATLIDGRNPSVPFLGAQEWAAISFPMDDLASAELVRGPSAALYGANASSGILNMVTRQPRYSKGGQLRLTAGELSTLNADLRYAGEIGSDWYVKVVAGLRDHDDFSVSRRGAAEYATPCPVPQGNATGCLPQEAVPLAADSDEITFYGLRFDKYLSNGDFFTLEGGTATIEGPVFQTGIGRVQLLDVDRPWARINYTSDHFNVLGAYTSRDAPRQLALASGANLALDTERLRFEVQGNWDFADGDARLVAGAYYGEEDLDSFDPLTGRQSLMFEPVDADFQAAFAQVDWNVSDDVKLVLAARYDDSSLHDSQVSPKGALVWSITPSQTIRFTYNEAFQVANYSEFFLQAPVALPVDLSAFEGFCAAGGVSCGFAPGPTPVLALGNSALELEEIETWEIGYSGILGGKAFLTIDYYNSASDNFITDLLPQLGTPLGRVNPAFGPYQPPDELADPLATALLAAIGQAAMANPALALLTNNLDGSPILGAVSYTNFGEVDTQGIDLGLNYYFDPKWTFSFAYSWFDFDVKQQLTGFENLLVPNTPENKLSAGLAYAEERFDAGLNLRWVEDFLWAVGPFVGTVESYTIADIYANWAVDKRWTFGLNVSNVTDEEHFQSFGGDLLGRRALGTVSIAF